MSLSGKCVNVYVKVQYINLELTGKIQHVPKSFLRMLVDMKVLTCGSVK